MNLLKQFEDTFGRKATKSEAVKLMNLSAQLDKDKVRKTLHGNTKNISAENKFKLHKNNGKREK
tara:strand:+ start:131 stop:322 length:192 start_codon:yes stop_codon:yes gene_type:complete